MSKLLTNFAGFVGAVDEATGKYSCYLLPNFYIQNYYIIRTKRSEFAHSILREVKKWGKNFFFYRIVG